MKFALTKYKLTHFTRRRGFDLRAPVTLAETIVHLEPSVKILGVVMDSRLRWKGQEQAVKQKMKT